MVLGEVFTNEEEIKKFSKDLSLELVEAYKDIPSAPVSTIIFTGKFYKINKLMQENLFSFCRLLGFSVVRLLVDYNDHVKI